MKQVVNSDRSRYRAALVLAVLAMALPLSAVQDAGAGDVVWTKELRPEKPLFWETADLGKDRPGTPELCGIEGPCPEFILNLVGAGERLRVALDHDDVNNLIRLQLFQPGDDANPVAEQTTSNTGGPDHFQSAEVFASTPAPGSWRVRIVPACFGLCAPVRLRAKLEPPPRTVQDGVLLFPDLRAEPPFDLRFSCRDDERDDPDFNQEMTCLRFAFGPHNVGDGPLAFNFGRWALTTSGTVGGTVVQRVYRYDSTPYEYTDNDTDPDRYQDQLRQFDYQLHEEHRHFHIGQDGYSVQQLFRVIDPVNGTKEKVATGKSHSMGHGSMEGTGEGDKTGFCLMDSGFARWSEFSQDPRTWTGADCRPPSNPPRMGISKGWRDVYYSSVHGNYVEFPTLKGTSTPVPGPYVVQVRFDPKNYLVEKDEDDNYGYAYIEVKTGAVKMLERGQGLDPWDPKKVLCGERRC